MPEYLSPGVYIEEQNSGPQPISGVSTSTTGFVGMTVRGPVGGLPVLVTSFAEFTRKFGGFIPDSPTFHEYRYLPYAVKGFFDNLGQLAYISRVPGQGNSIASDGGVLAGGLLTRLAADVSAGSTTLKLATTRGITAGGVVVTVNGTASNGWSFSVGTMPLIASLSEPAGPVGASLTIHGVNFGAAQGTSTVTINGTAGAPTSWSDTQIVLPVPAGATTGNVIVTVGGVASNARTFAVGTSPVIVSLSDPIGPVGSNLTITGVNFGATQGTSTITFNGTAGTPTTWSDTQIVVPVPVGAATGDVVVTVGVVASNGLVFVVGTMPFIISLSEPAGPVGASLTITGGNFGATQGTSTITFNGTAGTPTTWSDTQIVVPVPAGATTGNIVVTVGGSAGNSMPFSVGAMPMITSVSEPGGPVGATLTINGINFGAAQGTSTVTVGGVAATPTSWSDTQIVVTVPAGAGSTTHLTFRQVKNGITTQEGPIAVRSYLNNGQVILRAPLVNAYQALYTTVVTDEQNPGTQCQISASDPGAWGTQINVQIQQSSQAQAQVVAIPPALVLNTVLLSSTANFYPGAIVEFNRGTTKVWKKVLSVAGTSIVVTNAFATTTDLNPDAGFTATTVRSCEFDILATYGSVSEQWRFLSMDNTIPSYYGTVINDGSTLLSVPSSAVGDSVTDNPFIFPSAPDGLNLPLTGGSDGTAAPQPADYIGTDNGPGNRTGIQALIDADDIAIVAVPGVTSQDVQNALITQCETLKYRFAILDPAPHIGGTTPSLDDIKAQRDLYDTKYAAIYYPRITVLDPLTNAQIVVPPSGHMAGIYARVDDSRGVYKAPANELIGGIDAIEVKLSKGDQDVLNPFPVNINVLRDFTAQSRGLRVYGARCITSVPEWKYINVRRLFIFLEHSLDQGTQWAVFEPNDQKLWARLIQSVSAFLTSVWSEGGLMGAKASEAFFVRCDQTTMSPDDIDNGRLIMQVGVAPVYPAEFVIIQIGQWQGGSSVQEL